MCGSGFRVEQKEGSAFFLGGSWGVVTVRCPLFDFFKDGQFVGAYAYTQALYE